MKRNVLGGGALASQNKKPSQRCGAKRRKALAWVVAAWTLGMVPVAFANPVLDAKDAAVSISGLNTADMSITSAAADNLIKWVDFSIKNGETVAFDAKNYLNYVTGSARSEIFGTLTGGAGGKIYLVNPNGILIGDGATVNVGNLQLSTKALTAAQLADYATATDALPLAAIGTGDIINMGNLNATEISVEGNSITFKNIANVKNGNAINTNVTLTASNTGEIHIGSADASTPAYAMNGTDKKYMYKLVNNADELQNMKDNLAGNYMLAGDINMSGVRGLTPLGLSGNGFAGRFDGLNYQMKNLAVNSSAQYVGLFGKNTGVIENAGLVGGSVTGTNGGQVGGIAGNNTGIIRNVYNAGGVTGGGVNSFVYVGGIAGVNSGTIERAYNRGSVLAAPRTTAYVGGIAGVNSGAIRQVFNGGSVTGSGLVDDARPVIGGIAGCNSAGNILNAYNTGAIAATAMQSAKFWAGGIVGRNEGSVSSAGTVENVYNTGTVVGSGTQNLSGKISCYVGGLIGENKAPMLGPVGGGTLTNGYGKSGVVSVAGCSGTVNQGETVGENSGSTSNVDAKTEEELKQAATFTGFGFENGVWRIYENSTMPLLTAFLTRKDYEKSSIVYDGTNTVGAAYTTPTTYNGAQGQLDGYNYIKDVSLVTPANVIFTVDPYTRAYDGTISAEGATLKTVGTIYGDDTVSGGTFTLDSENAGMRTITVSDVTINDGNGGKNYNAIYQDGTGTITRKALELVADAKIITEGEELPTFTGNVTGFVENEGLANEWDLSFALDNPAAAAGSYKVTGKLNGAASGDYGDNYTFANAAANDTAFTIQAKYVPPTPEPKTAPTNPANPEPTNPIAPTNPVNPNPVNPVAPRPTPPAAEATRELPRALETLVGNEQAAKEYTDTVAWLESGKTVNLPTGEAANREQPALRPAIQMEQSQSAAPPAEHSLGIAYSDINMPISMSAEALAAALSGETTEQTPPLSADTKAVLAAEAITDRETAEVETDEE